MRMFDAHLHLQDPRLRGMLFDALNAADAAGVRGVCCCATSPDDVAEVMALPRDYKRIRIMRGFGVHPWHAAELATGWRETLEKALTEEAAACVGEIGLDGIYKEVSPPLQREVLLEQLRLAERFKRVVVLHGARAWNELSEVMKAHSARLPGYMFHAFSGPPEMLRKHVERGAFFSFSGTLCNPQATRVHAVARAVPLPQLLMETDTPDMFPVGGVGLGNGLNQPANVGLVVRALAELRGVAEEELCHATAENARKFFGFSTQINSIR